MANVQLYAGFGLIIFGLATFVLIPANPTSQSICANSVVSLTPQSIGVCSGNPTNLDALTLGNVYLTTATYAPTQITSPAPTTLTMFYELTLGTTLTSASLGYCANAVNGVCPSTTPIALSNQGINSNGFGSLAAAPPSFALNTVYTFAGTITDSAGTSSSASWAMQITQSSYTTTFTVQDSASGSGISGAQVVVSTSGGSPYANLTTGSNGVVTKSIPYGQFNANAYAKGYGATGSQSFYSYNSPSLTFTLIKNLNLSQSVNVFVKVQLAGGYNNLTSSLPAKGATVKITGPATMTATANNTGFAPFTVPQFSKWTASSVYSGYNGAGAQFVASPNEVVLLSLTPTSATGGTTTTTTATSTTTAPSGCIKNCPGGQNYTGLVIGVPSLFVGAFLVARGIRRKR